MKRLRMIAVALAISASATAACAHTLGAAYDDVRQTYGKAVAVTVDGARALELDDVDYDGFHWKAVDFVFDSSNRLSRMTMTSDSASYDDVLAAATSSLQDDDGVTPAAAPVDPGLQIRVCQDDAGHVTLTYEPEAIVS